MIGFNQKQEAMKLWELLGASRTMLTDFNRTDEQIAAACGLPADADLTARWYAALAFPVRRWQRSGDYALCFRKADKVQRQPYDLLASLPVQPEESAAYDEIMKGWQEPEAAEDTVEPTVDAGGLRVLRRTYLKGLTAETDVKRARILYDRLLRITPMRTLLARLAPLAEMLGDVAEPPDGTPAQQIALPDVVLMELREATGKRAFRAPIPLWQERRSGASLDLRGNNFTILDRLMDNWDRTLGEKREFVLPVKVIQTADHMPSLLTAAIVHDVARNRRSDAGKQQYVAIPGGHSLLGIYDKCDRSAPEKFFRGVTKAQSVKQRRLMRVRSYGHVQLLQLADDMERLLESAVFSDKEVGKPAASRPDVFCARDEGGRQLAGLLEQELRERRMLGGRECLEALVKGEDMTDAQTVRAIGEMEAVAAEFFRQDKVPEKATGDIGGVKHDSGNIRWRAMGQLMAYAARERMLFLPCPDGQVPTEVTELLRLLEGSGDMRGDFLTYIRLLPEQPVKVNMRFCEDSGVRELRVMSTPEQRYDRLLRWRSDAEQAMSGGWVQELRRPDFTMQELAGFCRHGLMKFIYNGTGMRKGKTPFSLAVAKVVVAQDIYFRLACLWFRLRCCGRHEPLWIVFDRHDPDGACFVTDERSVRFADVFAHDETEAADAQKLTPERLRAVLTELTGEQLQIQREADQPDVSTERFRITLHFLKGYG